MRSGKLRRKNKTSLEDIHILCLFLLVKLRDLRLDKTLRAVALVTASKELVFWAWFDCFVIRSVEKVTPVFKPIFPSHTHTVHNQQMVSMAL